jgi:hypothetical protein
MATSNFTVLNDRKRKYLEARVQGLGKMEAKRIAGYAETTMPSTIENSSVKAAFSRLVRQYVPAHHLAKRIAEGLDAMETKFFQHEGRVTDSKDLINWTARHNYAKLAAEFGQYVEPEAKSQNQVPIEVTIKFIGAGRPALRPVSFALIDGIAGGKNTNG